MAASASDVALKLRVLKPDGSPYEGTVDIECQHQVLSDLRDIRGVSASGVIAITGLRRTPQGLYKITVTPTEVFTPEGQFVNIPASGFAELVFTFAGTAAVPVIHHHDPSGAIRDHVELGDSLAIGIVHLAPSHPYDVTVSDDTGRKIYPSRLFSDRSGTISAADLWPQAGLNDPFCERPLTIDEALARWGGRTIVVEVHEGRKPIGSIRLPFRAPSGAILVSMDADRRLQNAFETGKADANIGGINAPFTGRARVYMVPSQRDWVPGDPFVPVQLASGRAAWADFEIGTDRRFGSRVARARELRPGSYDFIVRQMRYGYEDDEDFTLRATDIVTRRYTGLVVRMEFMASKAVRGGCPNMLPIAGRMISGPPWFQYADTFEVGENIYGSLDPIAVASQVGKMFAYYVVEHKSAAQWGADPSLQHLAVLGGNPAVQKLPAKANCVSTLGSATTRKPGT